MAAAAPLTADPSWPLAVILVSGGANVSLYSLPGRAECDPAADPTKWSMVCEEAVPLSSLRSTLLTCTEHFDFPISFVNHHNGSPRA